MGPGDKQTDYKSLLKRSLLKIEDLQSRLEKAVSGDREPVAVVGIGCRFPGESNDPETFWQNLRDGVDTTTEVPPDRCIQKEVLSWAGLILLNRISLAFPLGKPSAWIPSNGSFWRFAGRPWKTPDNPRS